MPTDTLQPSSRRIIRLAVAPATPSCNAESSCPVKTSPGIRKPSAVERLEADKAKYVKSQQVVLKKQQPVISPSNNSQNVQVAQQPSRKIPARPTKSETPPLNMEHLCKLIDGVSDATVPVVSTQPSRKAAVEASGVSGCSTMTVRRVDVRPQLPQMRMSPPSPAITRISSTSSRKRPSLTRSKSDVSDCFSRAGAELERFFNYCGLDPSDLEELARPGSDIVSVSRLRSASAPASERSAEGEVEEEAAAKDERPVYGVSVIERNARVIKWLYGMRQAKERPKVADM
uniref:Protein FAM110A-like n=1 Tax=Sinocyclocheilus grahami TaxID=75366 RepID=A0A672K0R3_SINGR